MDSVANMILLYGGAIAGFIAFAWKAFEQIAASTSNKWDDKIVQIVQNVAVPLVRALEENTKTTAENSNSVSKNSEATEINSTVTAPPKA